jgi:hypothetical protein
MKKTHIPIAGKRSLFFVNELYVILHSGPCGKAPTTVFTNVGTLLFVDLEKKKLLAQEV